MEGKFRNKIKRETVKRKVIFYKFKGSGRIHSGHTKGLNALIEEQTVGSAIIVSLEEQPRKLESSIEILPWKIFLERLWSGGLGV